MEKVCGPRCERLPIETAAMRGRMAVIKLSNTREIGQRRSEEVSEKREAVEYEVVPLKPRVPRSLIISWREDLDGGITRGINTADFPPGLILPLSASFPHTRIAITVSLCQQEDQVWQLNEGLTDWLRASLGQVEINRHTDSMRQLRWSIQMWRQKLHKDVGQNLNTLHIFCFLFVLLSVTESISITSRLS